MSSEDIEAGQITEVRITELRRDIQAVREARRRAERQLERMSAVEAAIEDAKRDLAARSSPALRAVEERAERIRERVAVARRTTDALSFNVHRLSTYWRQQDDAQEAAGEELAPLEHPELLPGVRKIQAALDAVAAARTRTDAVLEGPSS